MEQETQKIKELDEQYSNELREWKQQLVPRKQVSLTFSWLSMITVVTPTKGHCFCNEKVAL